MDFSWVMPTQILEAGIPADKFYELVEAYDHTEFTAWLDAEDIERGKMDSRRDENGSFLGYEYDNKIMDAIKRGTLESFDRFTNPYLLHLTIFINEENDTSGFFNALDTACERELGFRPIHVAAIERKRQEEIERRYPFRPDGFHYQCPIWVEYSSTVQKDLKRIIKRQRGHTVLDNPRAARITGGHHLKRSAWDLYMGLKHLGGYAGKIHPTKPKSQTELNKWLTFAGIKKRLKRYISSRLRSWEALQAVFLERSATTVAVST